MKNITLDTISDDELVALFKQGDESAFEQLLRRYDEKIKLIIANNVWDADERKDVYQTICINILRSLRSGGFYKSQGTFANWICTVSKNAALQIYRDNKRDKTFSYEKVFYCNEQLSFESTSFYKDEFLTQLLLGWMKKLPPEQEEVLRMHYFEDMPFRQIAEATNASINTVLGRARYAKVNLFKLANTYMLKSREVYYIDRIRPPQ